MKNAALLLLIFSLLVHASVSFAVDQFSLEDGDVVVFLGGTDMVRAVRSGELETGLTREFVNADTAVKFRDLSWEADTVYRLGTVKERWRPDGFGQRTEQLERVGMTVAVLQFGQMEAMDGEDSLPRFVEAYRELLDSILQQAREVVVITPRAFEKPKDNNLPDLSGHNQVLAKYVDAIKELVAERNGVLVDLYQATTGGVTENGLHVAEEKIGGVSNQILGQLQIPAVTKRDVVLLGAVREKQRLWYDYWRPANWKLLYGDDARREFTKGGDTYIPFREEWTKLLPLVDQAEKRIVAIAVGMPDPGHNRPIPEVLHGDRLADIQNELKAFEVAEGFEVSLFASEEQGLTSPLNLRWDPNGRMYVTVTTTYPHVWPGDIPNDKVIVLEDVNSDGKADRSTLFAEGLNIPTGIEWGDGGIYIGQNTEILFLEDTDGDLQADKRRVLLGGFGNGDSHQTINSFIWSPDGELYLGQGDGCESRVETPWGNSELYQAGFYRLRPRRLQLDPLLDDFMGPGNPWGVAFNKWGQIFCVDGAGGVTFLSPGQIPVHHRRRLGRIGDPGGYCGVGLLDGRHLPEDYQGDFVVGDFKQNRIKRFSLKDDGAGFQLEWEEPLLTSSHRNFRPVDVKVGPDGAVYIVDWYNPITCHQDDAYRHPDRDKAHGRIWRVATTNATTEPVDLLNAKLEDIVAHLESPEHVTRYLAKRALTVHDPIEVKAQLDQWVMELDVEDVAYEHRLFEALAAYATLEIVEPGLLQRLLAASNPNARAYAARMVGRWHDRLDNPLEILVAMVNDHHPRVRLEAVMACAAIPEPESITVAAQVVQNSRDRWIDYAFRQAIRQLEPEWRPAFEKGQLMFGHASEMAAVLSEAGGGALLGGLKRSFYDSALDANSRQEVLATILTAGNESDIQEFAISQATYKTDGNYNSQLHAFALRTAALNAIYRDVRPAGDWQPPLLALADSDIDEVRAAALLLAGAWDVDAGKARIYQAAGNSDESVLVRKAAFHALSLLEKGKGKDGLLELTGTQMPLVLRIELLKSLSSVDVNTASLQTVELLVSGTTSTDQQQALLTALLSQSGGAESLNYGLREAPLTKTQARTVFNNLLATGQANQNLFSTLAGKMHVSTSPPEYSESLVKTLKKQAERSGDANRGATVFKAFACVACHRISGKGGTIGPDLTGLGTTLSGERIIEEVIWPNRQVKEGFTSIRVITQDGQVLQGFERKTKRSEAEGGLALLDPQTQDVIVLAKEDVDEVHKAASVMPEGLTNLLSPQQLSDLLAFLMMRQID